jgi:hypothetical protein
VPERRETTDEKWDAYHGTVLEFAADERPCLRIDLRHPDTRALADRLAALHLAPPVAIMTAENPQGANAEDAPTERQEARQAARNDDRHEALLAELREAGMPFARVDGVAPDGEYRERCVALPLGRDEGRALARRLGQLAFFWFDGRQVWLEPGLADHAREVLPVA